jgi:hypothetical protein
MPPCCCKTLLGLRTLDALNLKTPEGTTSTVNHAIASLLSKATSSGTKLQEVPAPAEDMNKKPIQRPACSQKASLSAAGAVEELCGAAQREIRS